MFARSQNALRGRWENLWSSEPVCVVKLVGREAVIDKLVYTAANPVHDHLVERVHHWPGSTVWAHSWRDGPCAPGVIDRVVVERRRPHRSFPQSDGALHALRKARVPLASRTS
jgi:hypothetical protein